MIEVILDNLLTILTVSAIIIGSIWGVIKYNRKRVKDSYDKGRKEESIINQLKTDTQKALDGVKWLDEEFKAEKKEADEHHKRMYTKLDGLQEDVSFIKGKLE